MSSEKQMHGHCLCGVVSVRTPVVTDVEACHCGMCRRWGGGPFLSVHIGPDVEITGEEHITWFDSSEWAERGFCRHCGTHLFYKVKLTRHYIVPAGLFTDQSVFEFKEQILVDRKPDYYEFANQTRMLTEKQFFEKYAQQ